MSFLCLWCSWTGLALLLFYSFLLAVMNLGTSSTVKPLLIASQQIKPTSPEQLPEIHKQTSLKPDQLGGKEQQRKKMKFLVEKELFGKEKVVSKEQSRKLNYLYSQYMSSHCRKTEIPSSQPHPIKLCCKLTISQLDEFRKSTWIPPRCLQRIVADEETVTSTKRSVQPNTFRRQRYNRTNWKFCSFITSTAAVPILLLANVILLIVIALLS